MTEVTEWAASTRRKGPPRKVLVGAVLAVAAIAYLILSGMRGTTVYSLTIGELKARGEGAIGQGARVSGILDASSVSWDADAVRLEFELKGDGEADTLHVVHEGVKPDMFNDGAEVIVEGKLLPGGVFEAKTLLLKCPSKYESGTPVYEATPNAES